MLKYRRNLVLDVFDYAGNKQCSLYDQTSEVSGQAHDVVKVTERNGWKEVSFVLPQQIHTEDGDIDNFRVPFIKEGYKIRLIDDDGPDWFIISESKITHNNFTKSLTITAGHVSQLLKHKKLDLEFSDDEGNNVGTAAMLLTTILEDTGWEPGYVDTFFEKDGVNEKYRSLKASAKTGAFKLIANMCDLFEAKPVYHGDSRTVDIIPLNPFSEPKNGALPDVAANGVIELHYGTNVSNVSRTLNEENMITKLYAYGAYGDKTNGYCGIDECTHTVYTLIVGEPVEPGTECQINLTDKNGINIVRYFTIENDQSSLSNLSTILWSDLDPASRMYVWDEANQCAYLLYESLKGNDIGAFFTEDESQRKEVTNWFSFLMDFHYYNDIGLLTNGMLQAIAKYQMKAPEYMEIVNTKATEFANAITTLSETIGSVDFCKLDCTIVKEQDGHVKLNLNTNDYPKGVVYRTDYTKKEDKQFKWRVATELKGNGDPVHDIASVVYIVYEPYNGEPLKYEKSYLKEIDDEENPSVLTLWLTSNDCKYIQSVPYRVYLFAQHNVNGLLGAYETADEATQQAAETAVKVVTVKHPLYYEKDEPSHSALSLNGYGWWWKWYEGNTIPSELYFCWADKGDTAWKRVIVDSVDPADSPGDYWFNWKKSLLYRKESGAWSAKKETVADKRMSALFGTVYAAGQTRDKYIKGVYQNYTYTADSELPSGNYAFENGYGNYWVFTTKDTLNAGDTLTYDSTVSTITQKVKDAETVIETKAYRFDNVNYHADNILAGMSAQEVGTIDKSSGGDVEDNAKHRTGFIRAYVNTEYVFNGYNGDLDVYYYDEERRYLGYETVYGMGGSVTTPYGPTKVTEVGDIVVGGTKYIRIVSDIVITADSVQISTPNVANKIITKEDETYIVLKNTVPSGELKGITPLTKKFADLADEAYGVCYPALKKAQDDVKALESAVKTELGDLYREGYWQKNDYVDGDEQKLYDDALDNLEKLSKPEAKYDINYLDLYGSNMDGFEDSVTGQKILWPDISTQSAAHLVDPEIGVNCWAFVDKVSKCYDQPWKTKISINTNLTTISQHSFTDVMSHIAEVSSEAKGRMGLYERASAITETGAIAAQRLEGKIDANKLLITGGSSTWYTDDRGNMVFVSADGNSAMTLTGNGFAIANSKDEWGNWAWRSFGDGNGFTADEITTGYLSAERIEAGSITTNHVAAGFGEELDISSNRSINIVVQNLENEIEDKIASIVITDDQIIAAVEKTEHFVTKDDAENYATKDDVDDMIGYRMEIISTSDVLSSDITSTTLSARVWHGNQNVTADLPASRFQWKRISSDTYGDEIWNNQHSGLKAITINTLDVYYSATYYCELSN